MPTPVSKNNGQIPTSLASPGAVRFWLAVCLIGASTGLAAAALTRLLGVVQRAAWNGSGTNILETARQASAFRHIAVLLAAGTQWAFSVFEEHGLHGRASCPQSCKTARPWPILR